MSAANTIQDIFALNFFSPLHELDHDKLAELAQQSPLLDFKRGQPLVAGIDKNHIVYLLSGTVERAPGSPAAEIIKADSERARRPLSSPQARARVVAQSNVTALCVDAELLDLLLNWDAGGGFEVDEIDAGDSADWLNTLMQSDAVLSLSPASIQTLMEAVQPLEAAADTVIFRQGDRPDHYYIVARGRCAVTRRGGAQDAPLQLATLGPGDAFGEEALIANTERSATVRMVESGLLLRLDQHNFKQLLEQSLVHVIDHERAQSLKARGAVVLDLRSGDDFAIDGSGINIPFAELRSRMGELARDKKYLVMSDDNRMSAVAAFLLGKQRFKVYVLQSSASDGFAVRAAAATAQVGELRDRLATLQQQLDAAQAELAQERRDNGVHRQRLQQLETELQQTQAEARQAIVAAGSLKSRSESGFRDRIRELGAELQSERASHQALSAESDRLRAALAALESQLQQRREQADQRGEDEALMRLRLHNLARELGEEKQHGKALIAENDRLNGALAQLTRQLQEARDGLAAAARMPDRDTLTAELARERAQRQSVSERGEQLQQRLAAVEDELQQLRRREAQHQAESRAAQAEAAELQQALEALQAERAELCQAQAVAQETEQQLGVRLAAAEQHSARQAAALDELQAQLQQHEARIARLREERATLQAGLPQLEASLEESCQARVRLEQQVADLTRSQSAWQEQVATLTHELQTQAKAVKERDFLRDRLASLETRLKEKQSQFTRAEADWQQRLGGAERELNGANLKALEAAARAEQDISRLQLRIKVLTEELAGLRDEHRRGGRFVKVLLLLAVMLGGALGTATYLGIDVQGKTSQLMERGVPALNQFIQSLSQRFGVRQ